MSTATGTPAPGEPASTPSGAGPGLTATTSGDRRRGSDQEVPAVGGVLADPKQPQESTTPPRRRPTTTKAKKPMNEAASSAAGTRPPLMTAAAASRISATAPTRTSDDVARSPAERNAPTVDAGRRALTTPATATSRASAAYGPVSVTMRTLAATIRTSAGDGSPVATTRPPSPWQRGILVSAFHILDRGVPYDDLGADWSQHQALTRALLHRNQGRSAGGLGTLGVDEINTSGRRWTLGVRRVSLPTRGDHAGGALGAGVTEAGQEGGPAVLHPGAGRSHFAGGGDHRSGTRLPAPRRGLLPGAQHVTVTYANNRVEADHGRLKARLRPMRGMKKDRSLRIIATGHAFIQNLRRGHYELATDATTLDRVAVAFTELALAI